MTEPLSDFSLQISWLLFLFDTLYFTFSKKLAISFFPADLRRWNYEPVNSLITSVLCVEQHANTTNSVTNLTITTIKKILNNFL